MASFFDPRNTIGLDFSEKYYKILIITVVILPTYTI